MMRNHSRLMAGALVLFVAACSKSNADKEGQSTAYAETPAGTARRAEAAKPRELVVGAGEVIVLHTVTGLSTKHNKPGDPVVARNDVAVLSQSGDTIIPAHSDFQGAISAIASASTPRKSGTFTMRFNSVRFGGVTHPIDVRIDSMATSRQGRGITPDAAEKTAAGAVVGGIAGRIIGHNSTGTIIGAAAGAAAGGVWANQTRDIDIVLPVGSRVVVSTQRPFSTRDVAQN